MKKMNYAKLSLAGVLMLVAISGAIKARQQTNVSPGQSAQGQAQSQQNPTTTLKNIKVLKGMTEDQVYLLMRGWVEELGIVTPPGLHCSACHADGLVTETARKGIARWMQSEYVNGLKHKDGSTVNCKDCHQGELNPLRTKPFEHTVYGRKGLIVLKGISGGQLNTVMEGFSKALGVKCDYCHSKDFSENTPKKEITRYMMTAYASNLVKQDGTAVTCNHCHQGNAKLLSTLPFARRQQTPAGQPNPDVQQKKSPVNTDMYFNGR